MSITSLLSRFSVSFSLGFPLPPVVASVPAVEASVWRQTSGSSRVNSVLSWRILVSFKSELGSNMEIIARVQTIMWVMSEKKKGNLLARVGGITVGSDKRRVRGAVGCGWADCVVHNLAANNE